MDDEKSYNKQEVIDALNVSQISSRDKIELVDLVKKADCESFNYLTANIDKMEITLLPSKRTGEKRKIICGDTIEKILYKLGVKISPKFPSSIYISELDENKEGKITFGERRK